MKYVLQLSLCTIFWVISSIQAQDKNNKMINSTPFEDAKIRFEQNATDGDVEVVFEINGGDEGLTKLAIVSPDGRVVGDFNAFDLTTLGIRQFRFESPEPTDVAGLKAAYPEGIYSFSATSTSGTEYSSEAVLNHTLPPVVSFEYPGVEAEDIEVDNLVINWSAVDNIAGYIIEIDQEELGVNILVQLPGTENNFSVPDGFLKPDEEYILSIGTVSEDGNISVVETSFTTAE
jgi:hypothetical protein